MNDFWLRQNESPLFEDLEWNKPERKDQAGRLLIVGGNIHALTAPAHSYMIAQQLGIGTQKVVLPSKAKRIIGDTPFDTLFLPSTPSGEFAHDGARELLEYALWADTVLIPGDVGRNSQTTLLLSELLGSFTGQVVLTKDGLDALNSEVTLLTNRGHTTIVASIAQLQKLFVSAKVSAPVTFTMDLVKLANLLHTFTLEHPCAIVTLHQSQFIVAEGGKISTTKITQSKDEPEQWRNQLATSAACFQTWYPQKSFEALTHTAYLLR